MSDTQVRRPDRRTRYTRRLIQDTLLALMDKKPFSRVTVTELCRHAEINRGTFYLHYLDLDDALDDILRELMADTTCTLEHVLCPERACATYPFCDKIHSSPRYRAVFLDESVTERLLGAISGAYLERYTAYLMAERGLTRAQAEAVFTFQMNGCLAVNRLMLRRQDADWKTAQQTIDRFIRSGLDAYPKG